MFDPKLLVFFLKILLKNILKNSWGFDGVVISDWGGTHSTNQSIFNGLDIEMGTPSDKNKSELYPYHNNFLGKPFFEKSKRLIAIPFYEDDARTLTNIIYDYFY